MSETQVTEGTISPRRWRTKAFVTASDQRLRLASVHVGSGVVEAYEEAKRPGSRSSTHSRNGHRDWSGRFLVHAPESNGINIVNHSDEWGQPATFSSAAPRGD